MKKIAVAMKKNLFTVTFLSFFGKSMENDFQYLYLINPKPIKN